MGCASGWASVGQSAAVYPTALSIGYNPYFKNKVSAAAAQLRHLAQCELAYGC